MKKFKITLLLGEENLEWFVAAKSSEKAIAFIIASDEYFKNFKSSEFIAEEIEFKECFMFN